MSYPGLIVMPVSNAETAKAIYQRAARGRPLCRFGVLRRIQGGRRRDRSRPEWHWRSAGVLGCRGSRWNYRRAQGGGRDGDAGAKRGGRWVDNRRAGRCGRQSDRASSVGDVGVSLRKHAKGGRAAPFLGAIDCLFRALDAAPAPRRRLSLLRRGPRTA